MTVIGSKLSLHFTIITSLSGYLTTVQYLAEHTDVSVADASIMLADRRRASQCHKFALLSAPRSPQL